MPTFTVTYWSRAWSPPFGDWVTGQYSNMITTPKTTTPLLMKLREKVICGASSNGRWRSARSITSTSSVKSSWRSGRDIFTFVASGLDINGCVLSYFEGIANVHCNTSCTLSTLHWAKCNFFSVVTWKYIIKYLQKCEGCTHFCEILYMHYIKNMQCCVCGGEMAEHSHIAVDPFFNHYPCLCGLWCKPHSRI